LVADNRWFKHAGVARVGAIVETNLGAVDLPPRSKWKIGGGCAHQERSTLSNEDCKSPERLGIKPERLTFLRAKKDFALVMGSRVPTN